MTNTNLADRFNKRFNGYWKGKAIPDEIKFFITEILKQEKIKWLEALPKEKDYKVRDDFANWFDNGWNACLKQIKQQLTK